MVPHPTPERTHPPNAPTTTANPQPNRFWCDLPAGRAITPKSEGNAEGPDTFGVVGAFGRGWCGLGLDVF
mgnify:FL=1